MGGRICYLNTDLDLTSSDDLTILGTEFEAQGLVSLRVTRGDDGLWYATFETSEDSDEPESSIDELLSVIESLAEPLKGIWANCTQREFNIGYDCGDEPWAFNKGLSCQFLGRIAETGASLRITLYPDKSKSDN